LVADQDLTFAFPTAASFQGYAEFLNPEAANHLPASSSTVKAWIMEAYAAQKDEMMAVLHAAPGMIHITLDAWTSPNNIPFLGVIGHFISDDGAIDHLVLGLREIEGTHTGENLCVMLVRIVSQFNIRKKKYRVGCVTRPTRFTRSHY
jgi:hypothetical protein